MKTSLIAIFVTVIAGILLKLAEDRVVVFFSPAPIIGQAVVGPNVETRTEDNDGGPNQPDDFSSVARINLLNRSNIESGQVKIRIDDPYTSYSGYYYKDDKLFTFSREKLTGKLSPINIPSLQPGEDIDLIMKIDSFSVNKTVRDMDIYSNVGAAKIISKGVDSDGDTPFPDSFLAYLWEDAYLIISIVLLLIMGFMAIYISSLVKFYRLLMTHDDFYLNERVRYEKDGKKFDPDWTEVGRLKVGEPKP